MDLITSQATRALAARTDHGPFVDTVAEAVITEVWSRFAEDSALMAAMRASVTDNVHAVLSLFAGTLRIQDIPPPASFAFTDLAAEMSIPVAEIEAAYWIGLGRFWRRWFSIATEAAAAGEGSLEEFVGAPTELLLQYLQEVIKLVVFRYDAVCESVRQSRNDRRRVLITQVVDGGLLMPLDDIERELGYVFTGTHLGLALQTTERLRAEQLLANLAERVGAHGSLHTLHGADMWVCWLRFAGPLTAQCRDAVSAAFRDPEVAVSAGEPGTGIAGFRRTRQDALAVAGLRRRFEGFAQFLWFRDVSLEMCLLADEHAARRFIEDELGDLNAEGEKAERARETLLAWLSHGSSSQAAARLFLHENTVRMRVAQAQAMLPADLKDRRAEVLVALRLRMMLGASA